jgi:glycosyltransferase involved in cell wall biosynthesis
MRVSVIINNYNYERFLARAVESALRQTHPDVEVIVVDDGSRDGSLSVLQRYGAAILLVAKDNGGQGSAYNAGFERASGELVIFLDADDWLYPAAAAELAAAWRVGVVKLQFRLGLVDESAAPLGRYVPRSMHDRDAQSLVQRFGCYGSPPGSGNAFAIGFLKKILPLEAERWRTAADTVPILLAPLYGDIVSIPKILGAYRLHRRMSAEDLLFNNAPEGLWQEFARIEASKQLVATALSRQGRQLSEPLLLAPWECRIATLCLRFGGKAPGPDLSRAWSRHLFRFTLRSIWQWPEWGWFRKLLLSFWTVLVLYAPHGIARRLAVKHRQLTGVAEPATG